MLSSSRRVAPHLTLSTSCRPPSAPAFPSLCPTADSMFHHDPYLFLKHGPLSDYNFLFQLDGPDSHGRTSLSD